jgi:hypothetical protein
MLSKRVNRRSKRVNRRSKRVNRRSKRVNIRSKRVNRRSKRVNRRSKRVNRRSKRVNRRSKRVNRRSKIYRGAGETTWDLVEIDRETVREKEKERQRLKDEEIARKDAERKRNAAAWTTRVREIGDQGWNPLLDRWGKVIEWERNSRIPGRSYYSKWIPTPKQIKDLDIDNQEKELEKKERHLLKTGWDRIIHKGPYKKSNNNTDYNYIHLNTNYKTKGLPTQKDIIYVKKLQDDKIKTIIAKKAGWILKKLNFGDNHWSHPNIPDYYILNRIPNYDINKEIANAKIEKERAIEKERERVAKQEKIQRLIEEERQRREEREAAGIIKEEEEWSESEYPQKSPTKPKTKSPEYNPPSPDPTIFDWNW